MSTTSAAPPLTGDSAIDKVRALLPGFRAAMLVTHPIDGTDPRAPLVLQSDDASRYLHFVGHAAVVEDRVRMRELYRPLLPAWFPEIGTLEL
jgi:hypothetical protein